MDFCTLNNCITLLTNNNVHFSPNFVAVIKLVYKIKS
jgi:hypothetical protein